MLGTTFHFFCYSLLLDTFRYSPSLCEGKPQAGDNFSLFLLFSFAVRRKSPCRGQLFTFYDILLLRCANEQLASRSAGPATRVLERKASRGAGFFPFGKNFLFLRPKNLGTTCTSWKARGLTSLNFLELLSLGGSSTCLERGFRLDSYLSPDESGVHFSRLKNLRMRIYPPCGGVGDYFYSTIFACPCGEVEPTPWLGEGTALVLVDDQSPCCLP